MADLIEKKNRSRADFSVTVLTLILSLFGVAMVLSASYYQSLSKFGNFYHYAKDDAMWMAIGFAVFALCSVINYRVYKVFAVPVMAAGIVLLLLIFTPMGITLNNATRWLDFKFFTVMPGEIAKTCIIFFVAWYYARDPEKAKKLKGNLPVLGVAALCFLLIYKQPNLSTAGTVLLIAVGMMFLAGFPIRWILVLGVLGV